MTAAKRKTKVHSAEDTEMLPEYDFEKMTLQQGRTYRRLRDAENRRVLEPELAQEFPNDESVNEALREYKKLKKQASGAGA